MSLVTICTCLDRAAKSGLVHGYCFYCFWAEGGLSDRCLSYVDFLNTLAVFKPIATCLLYFRSRHMILRTPFYHVLEGEHVLHFTYDTIPRTTVSHFFHSEGTWSRRNGPEWNGVSFLTLL